jgi:hypothetical protein
MHTYNSCSSKDSTFDDDDDDDDDDEDNAISTKMDHRQGFMEANTKKIGTQSGRRECTKAGSEKAHTLFSARPSWMTPWGFSCEWKGF